MVFSSLVFVLVFFPVVVGAYHLLRGNTAKNIFLLIASLFFYSWGALQSFPIFAGSIVLNYALALLVEKTRARTVLCRAVVVVMLAANIALLLAFKYLGALCKIVNVLPGVSLSAPEWALPLGISFFTFSAISYVLDVYFEASRAEKNLFSVALYMAFFPKLISGPIMQWAAFEKQLAGRSCTAAQFADGLSRFIVGLAKKVIIADTVAGVADIVFNRHEFATISVALSWFGVLAYIIQLYFDFSGYSDMAVGLGKMLGFTVDENFNYPFLSKNCTEYWTRWHITLGTWVNHYIYTPVFRALSRKNPRTGKKRSAKVCDYAALLVSWCIIGPWHGSGLTYLAYGLYYCAFIMLERAYDNYKKRRAKAKNPVREPYVVAHVLPHVYFWLLLFFGQMIFRSNSIRNAGRQFLSMFGLYGNIF